MSAIYDGIKFYGVNDLSSGHYLEKIEPILDEFDEHKKYSDINEVIELYNIKEYIDNKMYLKSWNEEKISSYKEKVIKFNGIINIFFSEIKDGNFLQIYMNIGNEYCQDFWKLFCKFKTYEKLSGDSILNLLNSEPGNLGYLLSHKELVTCFSEQITVFMVGYVKSAEYLIDQSLIRNVRVYHFPKDLTKELKADIINKYIDSDEASTNLLRLIGDSQSTNELPLSSEVILKARRKYASICKEYFEVNTVKGTTIQVSFEELGDDVVVSEIDKKDGFAIKVKYNTRWIDGNLDYPTILTNFVYLFEFVDWEYRSLFVSLPKNLGLFERHMSVKGSKEYIIGTAFKTHQALSNMGMYLYYEHLLNKGISLEEVFKWFFEVYLKEEFGAEGFVFNVSSPNTTYLEKHRNLSSEMEGVLKQFQLYVDNGCIDRELLEISSNPIIYRNIGSLINDKYIYANSNELKHEINHWFSGQTSFGYRDKEKKNYKNLYELLKNEIVNIDEIQEWNRSIIYWLEDRGCLKIDENGVIKPNWKRVYVLHHLYNSTVACLSYYEAWEDLVKELEDKKDISIESKLFTIPEADFINFMLNRSQFSNGHDLRNKYSHGTNSQESRIQQWDYMELIKIMVLIVLKINEEFCLKYPNENGNVIFR